MKLKLKRFSLGIFTASSLLLSSLFAGTAAADSEKNIITFGVVPQQSASKLAKVWGPILGYLSAQTGKQFRFSTAPSIPEFERRVRDGEYDIAYMNPYHYTEFSAAPGYKAFGKARGKQIRGIVVVAKDSPIESLEELRDQTLAFPAPAAFAASVLPRAHMANEGIDISTAYVSSHDSVYMSVANGLYPAGGGIKRTLSTVKVSVRNKLRVLWTTNPYTSHALAAHPELDSSMVEEITGLLVGLDTTEEGRAMLKKLAWKGVEAASDERWDDVRDLGIDLLKDLVASSEQE